MENSYPWAKALNISEIDLERWLDEAPPESHLLNWCLDHEKINADEYYQWAKDHYGLAMLNEEFFKNPPNQELWKQIESVTNWSPNMVPIRQWDGVVFIACVEPQTQIPWSFPVQFLLAPRRELIKYWMNLHSSNAPATSEQKPDPVQPPTSEDQNLEPPQQQSEKNQQMAPEGFPDFEVTTSSNEENSNQEAPIGFDIDVSSESKNDDDLFSGFESVPSQQSSAPTMDELESTLNVQPQENPIEAFDSIETPASTNDKSAPSEEIAAESFEHDSQDDNEPASDLDEATAILNTTNVTQKQSPLIGELKTRYQNVVILKMQNQELIPYDWDSGLQVDRKTIDIEQPSFLKVVYKSQKPYHGYLAENQFHQNLFKTWGLDSLPTHVTAMPIIEDNKISAVVIGIGDEGCAGFQMIHFVESAIKKYPLSTTTTSESKAA